MEYTPAKVVAEVGAVHIGSVDRAKELIKLAALAGADYVKFQKRNPHESVPEKIKNEPHPNSRFAYGKTYLDHRLALELDIDQHRQLKKYCDECGIGYACSVWDMTSADEIVSLNPDYIKIPSACNENDKLLKFLVSEYRGDIHISTGMILPGERATLFEKISKLKIEERTVLYHCTSEYPCPFEHLYLLDIEKLHLGSAKVIGFSNHGYGIVADIVAYTLGARWIERHLVDDRTFPHTDASASLEPDGMRRLCRDLKSIQKVFTNKIELSEEELGQKQKLKINDD